MPEILWQDSRSTALARVCPQNFPRDRKVAQVKPSVLKEVRQRVGPREAGVLETLQQAPWLRLWGTRAVTTGGGGVAPL